MITHINVLASKVKTWILTKMNRKLHFSYFMPNSCKKFFFHNTSLQASTAAMYSATDVDNDMHFYNLDYHDTARPT
jgi:hypothetical protein